MKTVDVAGPSPEHSMETSTGSFGSPISDAHHHAPGRRREASKELNRGDDLSTHDEASPGAAASDAALGAEGVSLALLILILYVIKSLIYRKCGTFVYVKRATVLLCISITCREYIDIIEYCIYCRE